MATSTPASLGEHMSASHRPGREYIAGELREHGRIQALLTGWLGNHESACQMMVSPGWRVKAAPAGVRISDVAVVRPGPQTFDASHSPASAPNGAAEPKWNWQWKQTDKFLLIDLQSPASPVSIQLRNRPAKQVGGQLWLNL